VSGSAAPIGYHGEDSVRLYRYDGVCSVMGVKYGVELTQVADIQNNSVGVPHDWSYYIGTSQTDYVLDGVGNRKTVIRDGQTESYVTNSVNEYVYVNNQRLMYDANGNLTQWDGKTLRYNHNNQLVQVDVGEDRYAFRYDALGRKLAEKVRVFGMWYWRYQWHDGQQVIEEETPGIMPAERFYAYGVLIDEMLVMWWSMNGGWMQAWRSDDALGSTYVLTDDAEDVLEVYGYDIYGQPSFYDGSGSRIDGSEYDNRCLFTGREWHPELSLYYYRARWMVPRLGRFAITDPKYTYAERAYIYCTPTVATDPTGQECCVEKIEICRELWYPVSVEVLQEQKRARKVHHVTRKLRLFIWWDQEQPDHIHAHMPFVVRFWVLGDPKECKYGQDIFLHKASLSGYDERPFHKADRWWESDVRVSYSKAADEWLYEVRTLLGFEQQNAKVAVHIVHEEDIDPCLWRVEYLDIPGFPDVDVATDLPARFRMSVRVWVVESDGAKIYGRIWTMEFYVERYSENLHRFVKTFDYGFSGVSTTVYERRG